MDTSTPWAWRLDPLSGHSSSLGPSTSASLISTDPLSSLSKPLAGSSSADGVFWQEFRPPLKRLSRKQRKRARLHRFDSDEEDDKTVTLNEEGRKAEAASEDEDANDLGHTSSEGSDSEDDDKKSSQSENNDSKTEMEGSNSESKSNISPQEAASLTQARLSRRKQHDPAISSTQLIAHAIHSHISSGTEDVTQHAAHEISPSPLTYKETVRLTRLIAMLFRFPKSSRRIVRRRARNNQLADETPASHPSSASSTAAATEAAVKIKSKYRSESTPSSSSSRKPRILARVHQDDAKLDSRAVLQLIALIPAALPARVGCVDWVVEIATEARRDEIGNILLPDRAYTTARQRLGLCQDAVKAEEQEGSETVGKVTRSMRQRLGQDAPSIPLPEFWRRRGIKQEDDRESGPKVESDFTDPSLPEQPAEEAEVDALTATAPQDQISNSTSDDTESTPQQSVEGTVMQAETSRTKSKVVNLSKLLAERMREKRQMKTLLLRTHQSLRKRKSTAEDDGERGKESSAGVAEGEGEDEEEGMEADAETLANTVANSGATRDDNAATEGNTTSGDGAAESHGASENDQPAPPTDTKTVKQEQEDETLSIL
ncbi:uncharacterized protein UTRI_00385_B [Ustilago trichophora]|uniref:Uncharacterized protein n=1 Tax=Ustilago trichophora TaxID=86804 RepID=A0A5C3DP55_9BASI|nr:uncharacterized protein UTRI_00385_B [Ustilago trichophora]